MNRRELLDAIVASPLLTLLPKSIKEKRITVADYTGICMLFKYCKQHRWDICNRFIKKVYETFPDIKAGKVEKVFQCNVFRMLANKDRIHYITVTPSSNPECKYWMTFTYIQPDDLCLSVPLC